MAEVLVSNVFLPLLVHQIGVHFASYREGKQDKTSYTQQQLVNSRLLSGYNASLWCCLWAIDLGQLRWLDRVSCKHAFLEHNNNTSNNTKPTQTHLHHLHIHTLHWTVRMQACLNVYLPVPLSLSLSLFNFLFPFLSFSSPPPPLSLSYFSLPLSLPPSLSLLS